MSSRQTHLDSQKAKLELVVGAELAYRRFSAPGRALESVFHTRIGHVAMEAKTHGGNWWHEDLAGIYQKRLNGSRFLDEAEWQKLKFCSWQAKHPELIEQLTELTKPWAFQLPNDAKDLVVLDAKPLQQALVNGTKNHALALAAEIANGLPKGLKLALLTSNALPALEPEIASMATVEWKSSLLNRTKLFVRLATAFEPQDADDLDLIRAPWITKATVFLDDILGAYPAHYLSNSGLFLLHQLAIEKMKSSRFLLPLGVASENEAREIWARSNPNLEKPEYITTSCLPGTKSSSPVSNYRANQTRREILVFGNQMPHKNRALAAAAAGLVDGNKISDITFLGRSTAHQQKDILELAKECQVGIAPNIMFATGLDQNALSVRLKNALAVVIPSYHEGFSLPVVEALEHGTPVVLSKISAHQELLDDGPWFFDPRSVSELAGALNAVVANPATIFEQQLESLNRHYNRNRMAQAVHELFESVEALPEVTQSSVSERMSIEHQPLRTSHSSFDLALSDSFVIDISNLQPVFPIPESWTQDSEWKDSGPKVIRNKFGISPDEQDTHAQILNEIHSSLTWKVGRAILWPALILQKILRRGSSHE